MVNQNPYLAPEDQEEYPEVGGGPISFTVAAFILVAAIGIVCVGIAMVISLLILILVG